MKRKTCYDVLTAVLGVVSAGSVGAQSNADRTSLPIREPDVARTSIVNVRDAKAPARFQVKAPEGAPNVLIVLIDDMGFGQSSTFGGPLNMPTLERLANNG